MVETGAVACPCCGYGTLSERGGFEICPICWWEDDGQDNENADEVRGGPNADLSLSEARANFLERGIAFPKRTDLSSAPTLEYPRLRRFELLDGRAVEVDPA